MRHKSFSTHLKRSIPFVTALLVVFSITLAPPSQVAKAATITVTTTSDGTGGPDCTLRDAITAANTDTATGSCPAGSGADTIVLGSGETYILTEDGLPFIESQITIEGNESTIERSTDDGTPEFRIFNVVPIPSGDLTLDDTTVSNGDPGIISVGGTLTMNNSTVSDNTGGGIQIHAGTIEINNSTISDNSGSGIQSLTGTVEINNSTVSDNTGTGIFNDYGSVNIDNSTVSGNTGGGINNFEGSVQIYNSTVSDNTGAGISNVNGGIHIVNSAVSGNTENTNGGGIRNNGAADIFNSTFTGNSADSDGGGIYNTGWLTLTQSTVSGNTAGGNGGGICNLEADATVTHSTISDNDASFGSGIFHQTPGTMELFNTIVADQLSGADCNGSPVTSLGFNLNSDGSCSLAATGDLSNTNPQLGPLADNGGPTLTHALLPGSPAIDAGSCSVYAADQRDYPRPVDIVHISNADDGCDMGAYEVQNLPPTISGTLAGQHVDDNATIDPFTAVTIADPDDDTLTVIASLDNANKGELTNLGGFTEGPSGTYTFTGSPASATTAIRGLTFVPTENRKTPGSTDTTTFTISADDSFAAPVTDDTTTVIATSINDPPTIAGTMAGQSIDDNDNIPPFTGVNITDPDKDAILIVTVSLDDPDKGVLTNLGVFVESPAGTYTFTGSPTASTTAIQGLIFYPTAGRVPAGQTEITTFTISADDSFAAPVTDDTTTVIVTAVEEPNIPPSISGTVAGQTVDDNGTIDPFSTVTISDPNTATITVTVSLDDPAKGDLVNLGGFVESPLGTYTFTGSPAESTTAIHSLTFDPTEDRVPVGQDETTTFTISADDSIAEVVTDDTTTVIVTVVDKTIKVFLPLILR